MESHVKTVAEMLVPEESTSIPPDWKLRMIRSEDCLSYIAWHEQAAEGLIVDPKREDEAAYEAILSELKGIRWLAVIDTHTHADHVSIAGKLASSLSVPLIMHELSPSRQVSLRVSALTQIPAASAPLQFIPTPGHTPDGICVVWGPFLFSGDTVVYGDTGRDDLPGGDVDRHFESLQRLRKLVSPEAILLPGHDPNGGRASTWRWQLQMNPSLLQSEGDFKRDALSFDGPAPRNLKEALRENTK